MGVNRRQRRKTKKEDSNSRPNNFYDSMQEVADATEPTTPSGATDPASTSSPPPEEKDDGASVVSQGSISDAQASMNARPDVSTVIVDEDTGIERILQGSNVMDVTTRKAIKLSDLGPEYRLAQMFPGVPEEIREKYRLDWNKVEVEDIVDAFSAVAKSETMEQNGDVRKVIPDHPKMSNEVQDFVLANRDKLGPAFKKTLGTLKLRYQSQFDRDATIYHRRLWKHFLTIEDYTSAPLRQMMLDAEGKVGMNFGNLDLTQYCSGELYERTACYLVLKGMVSHWEQKTRDAEYVESTPQERDNLLDLLMVGDPKRYLPDPPIIYRYNECVRIASMAQNMTFQFVNNPELFDDLPVEVRFIEKSTYIQGGTALRRFIVEEFCPDEGISPEGLREGVRRLDVQLSNMQIDPYGELKSVVGRLCDAMSVGTDDERDPYARYLTNLDPNGPGAFQTYTFDHDKQSMVRFLDNVKELKGEVGGADSVFNRLTTEAKGFLNFAKKEDTVIEDDAFYVTPDDRACGRPSNLGWLDLLGDEEITGVKEDVNEAFDSDNWREVIINKQR